MQPFWDKVLNAEQQKNIGHFYLRGGFDFSKLTSGDKILMKMLKVRLQKLKERTEDEQGMLDDTINLFISGIRRISDLC